MIRYQVPATSANLGIGFDTLGIALNIYDTFEVDFSPEYSLSGFMDDMNPVHNLFLASYKKACRTYEIEPKPIKAILHDDIPCSRGLGSSSAMIVGGIYAAKMLYDIDMSDRDMLKLATEIEGHPDNVAPAILGGLCINHNDITLRKNISDKWHFAIFIPDYEVKTSEARKVLKNEYETSECVNNISAALIAVDALENFNTDNIKVIMNDRIHEPYRKPLIKDYELCKKIAMDKGADAFIISGSGSTMLAISKEKLDIRIKDIEFRNVEIDYEGVKCLKS